MQQQPILPPRLGPGARIALVAPSGPLLERDDRTRAEALCRALGFDPVVLPHAERAYGYLAGTDEERLTDLNAALTSPEYDAVWCLRGGDGMNRIVAGVDFAGFARAPKAVIGFSDITVLLLALWRETGVVSFHGPVAREPMPGFARRSFEAVLTRAAPAGAFELPALPADVLLPQDGRVVTLASGRAEGRLVGGNLTLLQSLIGTRFAADLRGAILFLEDVNEDLYRIDRMLAHLRLAGVLDGVAGVAIGQFTDCRRATPDGGLGLDAVLSTYFVPLGVPVVMGLPIGHIPAQWTMPVGVRASLDADTGALALLEAAVR
ncbi:MAG: LD-carboxypeptidase [Gemmatimonadetes bacterium]|nr:LD-carboxypeptidase [Gemmatimonadota bacterium]